MFGWIKVIWRIRALKASLHAYQNEQLDRLHLLLGVIDALGRVAEVLKCEKLVQWTKKELNGYASEEVVPVLSKI